MTNVPATAHPPQRLLDLGREAELITWNEWFARTASVMTQAAQQSPAIDGIPVFRITLADRRQYLVTYVFTQVARGRCEIGPSRWAAPEGGAPAPAPVCDVITGYILVGRDGNNRPVTVGIPPAMIASVECVLAPAEKEPFGFARMMESDPGSGPVVREIEDTGPGLFDHLAPASNE